MRLLIVRHAIAETREAFARSGQDDSLRPLTAEGRKRMRRGARGLRTIVPTIDILATSPLVRAVQTAEIVAEAYDGLRIVRVDELSPEKQFPAFLAWLRTQDASGTIAAVGHEPHLSGLASWLLTARSGSFISLKKGSVCLLEFGRDLNAGAAMLLWALAPAQLRALGGKPGGSSAAR